MLFVKYFSLVQFFLSFVLRYTETDVIPCSGESSKEMLVKYVSNLMAFQLDMK